MADPIEREDVVAIMTSLMGLHDKTDRILSYLGEDDEQEEEEEEA